MLNRKFLLIILVACLVVSNLFLFSVKGITGKAINGIEEVESFDDIDMEEVKPNDCFFIESINKTACYQGEQELKKGKINDR